MTGPRRLLARLEQDLFVRSRGTPLPWGPLLRGLRFPVALIRDWFAGELNVRAMSLAYTTLLSIVPLIAFSISILKGIGAHANLAAILYEFFRPIGAAAPLLTASVMQFVKNMRGDVLGSIGLVFLLYTVVTTIQKVESSFNFVWRIGRSRSLARRFGKYLSTAIAGPVLLAAALGVLASAHDSPIAHWLGGIMPLQWTFSLLGKLVPYLVVTVAFIAMYALVPDTRVQARAAVIGGLSAGVLWALIGKGFTAFILYSSRLIAIYTGFALVLTTLIWVYLSWLVLLIGAQLAFYVQNPQFLRHGHTVIELAGNGRERAAFTIMFLIARNHAQGAGSWTGSRIAEELNIPGSALDPVQRCLERAGLITTTEQGRLLPGRDIRAITLVQVLDAVRSPDADQGTIGAQIPAPAEQIVRELEESLHARLAGRTLYDLIAAP